MTDAHGGGAVGGELCIRPASAADGDRLRDLDVATWSHLHAVTARPSSDAPFFDERHHPRDYLVAELPAAGPAGPARVVGYICVVPPSSLAVNGHVRQIQGLVVAPEARGAGVARALLRAGAEHARAAGARRLTLRVLGHNAPARRLYESEGFAVEGVLPEEFLLDGRYVDDVLMGRTLL
ncbi:N-acetyltransferase [Streptomyces sp. WMMC500]|uniref:GNAT family N-acetyltransferase n=1 Tax=Streptomyces sp. WMMC500 TaxID=3015154 RepID=UPI00248B6743|nr:N-acetyltransferase [Streptomyces sp. WMMC500]WBB59808.1 N-acetyltransferase [Streptomyces sp. WMMC500]